MLQDIIALIGGTFAALLPIANPFSTAPVFAAISGGMTPERRLQQARLAIFYMIAVLLSALLVGAIVLEFFGISIPALRIAGGLVVARVGFGMLNPDPTEELPDDEKREAMAMRDIAFTPIAMPLLSGPGSIAVTISMATTTDEPWEYIAVGAGIVLVAIVSLLILRSATSVVSFLGVTGMTALTRLMGFILVCIGVQFVALGLLEAITNPQVAEALRNAYR